MMRFLYLSHNLSHLPITHTHILAYIHSLTPPFTSLTPTDAGANIVFAKPVRLASLMKLVKLMKDVSPVCVPG